MVRERSTETRAERRADQEQMWLLAAYFYDVLKWSVEDITDLIERNRVTTLRWVREGRDLDARLELAKRLTRRRYRIERGEQDA